MRNWLRSSNTRRRPFSINASKRAVNWFMRLRKSSNPKLMEGSWSAMDGASWGEARIVVLSEGSKVVMVDRGRQLYVSSQSYFGRVTWFATAGDGVVDGCSGKQRLCANTEGARAGRESRKHVNMRLALVELLLVPAVAAKFTFTTAFCTGSRVPAPNTPKPYDSPEVCFTTTAQSRIAKLSLTMADSTLSHLNYGHAGTSTFDIDARDWSFARQFTATTLKQIGIRNGSSIDAIPAPTRITNTAFSTRLTDARDSARALVRNYPQLVSASELLPDLAATSAAVLSTTSTYDPLIGNLYSTGSITYVNNRADKWDNPRRVATTVTGETGNILRLGFLYQQALGWGSDKSVWIRADTLRNTECGYWNEEAAPIQQVCFSQSEDRSTLLAVRLLTKTVIFRPFYSQRPRPAKQSSYYNLPPSLIDANPILILENDESGGSPHVDVCFNPDFQLQFAVVDQNHVWSVWDIDYKRKSTDYKMSCLMQGSISPPENADQTGEDGWARVLWVGDVNTILVCNRRQLSIVRLKGSSFEYLHCSAVISTRTSDWILDVKRHPSLRSRFFVLTSTDVFLMGITTPSEAVDATVGPVGARVLLSWRHYRGAEDFTLSISVVMLNEDRTYTIFSQ